jgi:hypothetical protein
VCVHAHAALASSIFDAEVLVEECRTLAEESRGASPSSRRMVVGMLASVVSRVVRDRALRFESRVDSRSRAPIEKKLLYRFSVEKFPETGAAEEPRGRGG